MLMSIVIERILQDSLPGRATGVGSVLPLSRPLEPPDVLVEALPEREVLGRVADAAQDHERLLVLPLPSKTFRLLQVDFEEDLAGGIEHLGGSRSPKAFLEESCRFVPVALARVELKQGEGDIASERRQSVGLLQGFESDRDLLASEKTDHSQLPVGLFVV